MSTLLITVQAGWFQMPTIKSNEIENTEHQQSTLKVKKNHTMGPPALAVFRACLFLSLGYRQLAVCYYVGLSPTELKKHSFSRAVCVGLPTGHTWLRSRQRARLLRAWLKNRS
ncbi:hypothetical protein GRJ2_001949700 [Grus japonensis]|uniref:Uncharacterized protein n=1 Tax=Grus japonensis TaxID=30415 RepID=A0ABC9XCR9_GRUJA